MELKVMFLTVSGPPHIERAVWVEPHPRQGFSIGERIGNITALFGGIERRCC